MFTNANALFHNLIPNDRQTSDFCNFDSSSICDSIVFFLPLFEVISLSIEILSFDLYWHDIFSSQSYSFPDVFLFFPAFPMRLFHELFLSLSRRFLRCSGVNFESRDIFCNYFEVHGFAVCTVK